MDAEVSEVSSSPAEYDAPDDDTGAAASPRSNTDANDAAGDVTQAEAPSSAQGKPRRALTINASAAPRRPHLVVKTSDSPSSLVSERHQHARKVTRDIAALDFLQNIPMQAETQASERHPSPPRVAFLVKGVAATPSEPADEGLAGRRLPGFEAKIVRVPPLIRYRMTTKFPAASAVVRRWESMTAQQGILDSRVFFSRGCGYPLAASTLIRYDGDKAAPAPRKRFLSVSGLEPASYDWRGKSYFRLLHATWTPCARDRDSQDDHPSGTPYVANYLDDPEFRQGRHRHVVRGDKNIGPVVSSILLFVKPHELKEELNKKFREKHTWLHDSELSLSKIRNLKREALTTGQRLDMEVATIALACVYFEKLVLSHYVNKANRKLYMSVCLLLAAKFNEPKASDAMKLMIKQILAEIDATHSLPSREVLTIEFKIYAQLSFSLHVPLSELQPHFTRLLKLIESNPRKYLDEDVFNDYSKLVLDEKTIASRDSMGNETQDEGTDAEALLSDEDLGGGEGMEDDDDQSSQRRRLGSDPARRRGSLPPWRSMPSFTQWWRERTRDSDPAPLQESRGPDTSVEAET